MAQMAGAHNGCTWQPEPRINSQHQGKVRVTHRPLAYATASV